MLSSEMLNNSVTRWIFGFSYFFSWEVATSELSAPPDVIFTSLSLNSRPVVLLQSLGDGGLPRSLWEQLWNDPACGNILLGWFFFKHTEGLEVVLCGFHRRGGPLRPAQIRRSALCQMLPGTVEARNSPRLRKWSDCGVKTLWLFPERGAVRLQFAAHGFCLL